MKKKNLKAVSILTIIGSIIAAYANKPTKFNGTTYYSITDGAGGFSWVTTKPDPYLFWCATGRAFCTIVTKGGYIPQNNIVPNSSQATPTIGWNRTYKQQL